VVSRLGKQVFESGVLQPDAMARTMAVLQEYAGEIKQYGVDHVHLIGTEALRRARNNDQFGDLIRRQLEKVTFLKKREPEEVLIGVGGTITTIVAIKENLHRYDPEKINGFILDKKEVFEIFESLNRLTLTQRR